MIPKNIHYVWVGEKEKPPIVISCIESWKKYCPDYKFIEWNNKSLSQIETNNYVREAFESKKWAFVSDYLRLYALYHYGGMYCDTDLEITESLDQFRRHAFFTGFENFKGKFSPLTALMGAEKGNQIIGDLLAEYDTLNFIKEDGLMDLTPNVKRAADYFSKTFGLTEKLCKRNEYFSFSDRSAIYPSFYFCTPQQGKPNYSIHHFNGSWLPNYSRKLLIEIKSEVMRVLNFKILAYHRIKSDSSNFPISEAEQLLLKFPVFPRYGIAILKQKSKSKL